MRDSRFVFRKRVAQRGICPRTPHSRCRNIPSIPDTCPLMYRHCPRGIANNRAYPSSICSFARFTSELNEKREEKKEERRRRRRRRRRENRGKRKTIPVERLRWSLPEGVGIYFSGIEFPGTKRDDSIGGQLFLHGINSSPRGSWQRAEQVRRPAIFQSAEKLPIQWHRATSSRTGTCLSFRLLNKLDSVTPNWGFVHDFSQKPPLPIRWRVFVHVCTGYNTLATRFSPVCPIYVYLHRVSFSFRDFTRVSFT